MSVFLDAKNRESAPAWSHYTLLKIRQKKKEPEEINEKMIVAMDF